MKNKLQEDIEKEELLKDNDNIKSFNKQIRKDSNDLLREYYSEFCKDDENNSYALGAYKFLQFIIANK